MTTLARARVPSARIRSSPGPHPSRRPRLASRPSAQSRASDNCGQVSWVIDRNGCRYDAIDPVTSRRRPEMPRVFADLAADEGVPVAHEIASLRDSDDLPKRGDAILQRH